MKLLSEHGIMSHEQPAKKRKMEAVNNQTANPPVSAINYRWNDKNVFHAINEGRFPADKIFDRPHHFALLDKLPVTRGHSLLITKHPVATMFEDKMPPEALADAMIDLQVREVSVQQQQSIRSNQSRPATTKGWQQHFSWHSSADISLIICNPFLTMTGESQLAAEGNL